jgi:hypothetical protein
MTRVALIPADPQVIMDIFVSEKQEIACRWSGYLRLPGMTWSGALYFLTHTNHGKPEMFWMSSASRASNKLFQAQPA